MFPIIQSQTVFLYDLDPLFFLYFPEGKGLEDSSLHKGEVHDPRGTGTSTTQGRVIGTDMKKRLARDERRSVEQTFPVYILPVPVKTF